ncbi:hypothetical protein KFZ56_06025 [Virgibacillus sp. NKC19-3]|uniref:hypothetical protein n=1 Tax=Virgibacillus saliphilus TaxID=2831674 RepID=UPI001C9AEFB7|nr:hypothetical protein [Virgibacillus sp. NKC19-3]MBY7142642.1 hypothetical protein [Virgibacillus sp. NKC19-3]
MYPLFQQKTIEEAEKDQIQTQGLGSCVNDCLGDKNISQWAITGLGILCGASCTVAVPATAGTACYACINTAGMIGATAVTDCFDQCAF